MCLRRTAVGRKGERVPKEEKEEEKNKHENFRGLSDAKYWPGLMEGAERSSEKRLAKKNRAGNFIVRNPPFVVIF